MRSETGRDSDDEVEARYSQEDESMCYLTGDAGRFASLVADVTGRSVIDAGGIHWLIRCPGQTRFSLAS